MYKFTKIGVIILYPLVSLIFPIALLFLTGVSVTNGGDTASTFTILTGVMGLFSVLLLVMSGIYLYKVYKMKLFSKLEDGTRSALVLDYFATIFSILIIIQLLKNITNLI